MQTKEQEQVHTGSKESGGQELRDEEPGAGTNEQEQRQTPEGQSRKGKSQEHEQRSRSRFIHQKDRIHKEMIKEPDKGARKGADLKRPGTAGG